MTQVACPRISNSLGPYGSNSILRTARPDDFAAECPKLYLRTSATQGAASSGPGSGGRAATHQLAHTPPR